MFGNDKKWLNKDNDKYYILNYENNIIIKRSSIIDKDNKILNIDYDHKHGLIMTIDW